MNILLPILFLLLLLIGIASVVKRAPRYGPAFILKLFIGLLLVAVVFMAFTGRLHWLAGVAALALPLLKPLLPLLLPLLRFIPFIRQHRQAKQKSTGQQSEITTRMLIMRLDHDSGTISGDITHGPFKGKTLDQLDIDELVELYRQCQQEDEEAIRLLNSYIERHRSGEWDSWQQQTGAGEDDPRSGQQSAGARGDMDEQEALEILGLSPGADREEIINAYKRMMTKMHPDKGGSNYLASKINEAKELLLKRL